MEPKDISSYGGPYANYASVEDPTVQVDDSYLNSVLNDLAQVSHMIPKAIIRWTGQATAGNVPLNSADVRTLWGYGLSYAPTVTKGASSGDYTVTFPTTYTDYLGNTETFNAFAAQVFSSSATSALNASINLSAANVVSIGLYNQSGVSVSATGATITLLVW